MKQKTVVILLLIMLTIFVRAEEKPNLRIGGALRLNYNYSMWKDAQKERGGDFGYDVFMLTAKANYKKMRLNANYRFYPKSSGGAMLKEGWIGYKWNKQNDLQIGLTQVPFGVEPFNSNSWFFSINYYLGFEDDYDMGLKYIHTNEKWDLSLAFFKNAEELNFGNLSDLSDSRYSYDISSITIDGKSIHRNKEVNQINGQAIYKIGTHKIGTSLQYGGVYNLDNKEFGGQLAYALHYQSNIKNLNIKAQYTKYNTLLKEPAEQLDGTMAMTAFGAPYLVSAKGSTYTLGVAYNIDIDRGILDKITIYNDFGYYDKENNNFSNTIMNVFGLCMQTGNIYTYIDLAMGKNHSYLGRNWNNSFATGDKNSEWNSRLNINIGYYF